MMNDESRTGDASERSVVHSLVKLSRGGGKVAVHVYNGLSAGWPLRGILGMPVRAHRKRLWLQWMRQARLAVARMIWYVAVNGVATVGEVLFIACRKCCKAPRYQQTSGVNVVDAKTLETKGRRRTRQKQAT